MEKRKEKKAELERELNMVKIRYNKACEEINYRTEVEAKLYQDMDKLYTELAKYEDID